MLGVEIFPMDGSKISVRGCFMKQAMKQQVSCSKIWAYESIATDKKIPVHSFSSWFPALFNLSCLSVLI